MLLCLKFFSITFASIHEITGVEDIYYVHNLFFNILFLLAGLSGLVLSARLFFRSRKSTALSYLTIFVLAISMAILELVLYWSADWQYDPVVPLYRLLFFLWAPSVYLFFKKKLHPETYLITTRALLVHYSLFFLCFVSVWYVQSSALQDKAPIYVFFDFVANRVWFKAVVLLVYFILMCSDYLKMNSRLSSYHKKYIVALFVYYLNLIGLLVARAVLDHEPWFVYVSSYAFAVLFALFILFTGLVVFFDEKVLMETFYNPDKERRARKTTDANAIAIGMKGGFDPGFHDIAFLKERSSQKYKNSGLTESMVSQLKSNLLKLLEEDKVYFESDITLDKLAHLLNTDRYSASQVINQEFGKSFYELLNDYRVEEVKRLLAGTMFNESVIQVAYSVGFSNRVSFNKAFKKRTGKTPTEYMIDARKELGT